jgi:hypothetical protein
MTPLAITDYASEQFSNACALRAGVTVEPTAMIDRPLAWPKRSLQHRQQLEGTAVHRRFPKGTSSGRDRPETPPSTVIFFEVLHA